MTKTEINSTIENYCGTAVAYGKKLRKPIDGSLKGVLNLEKIFDFFYKDLFASPIRQWIRRIRKRELGQSHIEAMAKILGAVLGEQIRIKLGDGCQWTDKDADGKKSELHLVFGDRRIFPMEKAYKRLTEGRAENITAYYKSF